MIQIRPATNHDLDNISLCAELAYGKYIERMQQLPAPMLADFPSQIEHKHVHVAQSHTAFTGYVVFYPQENHILLESVAVLPAYSGQGIGKALMQYVERSAQETGFNTIELYTNEAMTENLSLYPRLGYTETARQQQDGYSRVFFRKLI